MATALITHEDYLRHDTGPGHPERPERLTAILRGLEAAELIPRLTLLTPQPVEPEMLFRIHDPKYVRRVEQACANGEPIMDSADTPICGRSYDIARLAIGGALLACERVMDGRIRNAFCLSRPPGHHAERDRAMGFCLFNNIAVAAEFLVHRHNLERVAIVDFDVHHGNGTQHSFEDRADVLFISLHEHPRYQYPGTGYRTEIGRGKGEGYTVNVPLLPGTTDAVFLEAYDTLVAPNLDEYRPQFVLVSAGFDASRNDPLGHLDLTPDAYSQITRRLCDVAGHHADGRLVSILEGGYDLGDLSSCGAAHVRELLG